MEKLVDKFVIAEKLDVEPATIDQWCSAKKIPFLKISGKCRKFRISDIERWLEKKLVKPSSKAEEIEHLIGSVR